MNYIRKFFLAMYIYLLISYYRRLVSSEINWGDLEKKLKKMRKEDATVDDATYTHELVEMVHQIGAYQRNLSNSCLVLSITAFHLLQKSNMNVTFCIGVQKYPNFYSHAWIEHKENPIHEDQKKIKKLTKILEV